MTTWREVPDKGYWSDRREQGEVYFLQREDRRSARDGW